MRLLVFLLFGLWGISACGQNKTSSEDLELLQQFEVEIESRLQRLHAAESDEARMQHGDTLHQLIIDAINTRGSFEYPFEGVQHMGILTSPDRAFRLFNWNISLLDESHRYYCILLYGPDEDYRWVELNALQTSMPGLQKKVLTEEKWLGCLYYDIVPVKIRRKTKYTLLGWDGHTRESTRKIIDILTLDNGRIRFGANLFKTDKGTQKRHILEYASEVMVSCKYDPKERRIVMDHLEPKDPALKGIFAYYGPDLTFDAYQWEKGKWMLQRDVDVRMNPGRKKVPYNDPNKRN